MNATLSFCCNRKLLPYEIQLLAKETKKLKKAFTQLQKTSKQDSNLSDSELEEEDLQFQFDDGFQFTQMEVKQTAIEFEPRIAKTLQTNTWHQNQT
jgi:hypothetical protein